MFTIFNGPKKDKVNQQPEYLKEVKAFQEQSKRDKNCKASFQFANGKSVQSSCELVAKYLHELQRSSEVHNLQIQSLAGKFESHTHMTPDQAAELVDQYRFQLK